MDHQWGFAMLAHLQALVGRNFPLLLRELAEFPLLRASLGRILGARVGSLCEDLMKADDG